MKAGQPADVLDGSQTLANVPHAGTIQSMYKDTFTATPQHQGIDEGRRLSTLLAMTTSHYKNKTLGVEGSCV